MAFTRVRGPGITTTDNYKVGVITASKFVGPFDGGVIGSGGLDVSGIVTATNLDVNGDGHVSGALTVTGNVSIGGTLTYMDVTNIDSVGIITAQEGIHLGIGATVGIVNVVSGISSFSKLNVVGVSTFSDDLFISDKIVHSGESGNNTTIRFPADDTFQVETDGSTRLKITDGDLTMLDYTAADKVGIGTNVLVAKLDVKNNSNIPVIKLNDSHYNKYLTIRGGGSPNRMVIDSYEGGGGGADIDLASNGITNIRSTSTWRLGIGTGTPLGVAHVNVGGGSTEPFVIERSGSGESIWSMKPYAGNLYFRGGPAVSNYATDRFAIVFSTEASGGDVQFFGTAAGITSCLWDASANTLIFNDDVKAAFGNGSDFTLQHNNAHAVVKNTTGRIYVLSDDVWFKNEADNKTSARFFEGNEVYLYNNDTVRLTTTSTGITVGGEVAATQDYPNQRPSVDFNFASVKRMDSRFEYERTGPASYVDKDGIVKFVGDNTPRFDHDPLTRECKGLLCEESRINLLPYSTKVVDNSSWSRAGVLTENTTAVTAPDGSYDAIALRDNGTTGQHTLYEDVAIGDITAVYTASCWIKAGSKSFAGIFCNGTGATGTVTIGYKINLSTGAVTYVGAGGFESGTSAIATEYPNGWWRFSVTGDVADSASGSGTFRWHVRPREDGSGNYAGNDSIGIYVWGLQLELGNFPTSYIPGASKGGTVTRGADYAKITTDEFSEFSNEEEWTLLVETDVDPTALVASPTGKNYIGILKDDGTYANYFNIRYVTNATQGDAYIDAYGQSGSSVQFDMGGSSSGYPRNVKAALAAKLNDIAFSYNGNTVQTDSSAAMPLSPDTLLLGGVSTKLHIKRVAYYPKRLPNSQLVTLTS